VKGARVWIGGDGRLAGHRARAGQRPEEEGDPDAWAWRVSEGRAYRFGICPGWAVGQF
jgi:hypothetical protein